MTCGKEIITIIPTILVRSFGESVNQRTATSSPFYQLCSRLMALLLSSAIWFCLTVSHSESQWITSPIQSRFHIIGNLHIHKSLHWWLNSFKKKKKKKSFLFFFFSSITCGCLSSAPLSLLHLLVRAEQPGTGWYFYSGSNRERTEAQNEAGVELSWSQWEECATTITSDHTSCLADSIRGPVAGFSCAGLLSRVSGKVWNANMLF